MIHVIATITVKPEHWEEFLSIFKANVPAVLAEEGCHGYAPTIDLDSGLPPQIPLRPAVVTIIEAWESLNHLKAHLQAPHMKTYKENTAHMLATPTTLQVTRSA